MALEFYERRFRKPSKKMQYFLAFTALLLAICLVVVWMFVRHKLSLIDSGNTESDTSSAIISELYTAEDEAGLLIVYTDVDVTRFIHVHTDPANAAVTVTAVPDDTPTDDGLTLSSLYQKHGGARAAEAVAARINKPTKHYLSLSADKAEKWFNRLENGLNFTTTAALKFSAADGSTSTLPVGEHTLGAVQITALLSYAETPDQVCADLLTAMLQQYLRTERHLASDFSFLANIGQTSLRIGDFNAYRDALCHLAVKNSEGACTITSAS